MRNLDLRKQLKTFGKGLLAAVATGGASEGVKAGKKIYETYESYNEEPKVGRLPSIVKTETTSKNKPTGARAISEKIKGVKATGSKMKKAHSAPIKPKPSATSTNAKPVGVKSVKTKTPSPEISKAKPTVKKTASSEKVKTKIKTNKRGVIKIKTKIK
jgi:hypothetical protein